MITVSRRAYLMGKPSTAIMRAAGRAASSETIRAAAQDEAHRRLQALLAEHHDPRQQVSPETFAVMRRAGADMSNFVAPRRLDS